MEIQVIALPIILLMTLSYLSVRGVNSATGKSQSKSPNDLQVTNKSSRSVQLLWGAPLDGTNSNIGYIIQYKEDGTTWGARMAQVLYLGQQTERVLSSLKPATVYNIRVAAKTEFDQAEPSNTITVTTVGEVPSQPPAAVKIDAADQNSLNVHWKPPANPGWHEEISGYYVGYKISSHDVPYTFETIESAHEPYQQYHLIITNLKASTRYSVVVQAFNKMGTGPMSDAVMARTTNDNSEQPPQYDVICNTLTSQSINVSWSAPPHSCTNSVRGFKIIYGPSELWHDENERGIKTASTGKITLYGLQKYTNYTIQVIALSATVDGTPSIPVRCETDQDVPGAPEAIKALVTSSSSVLVSWKAPVVSNGVVEQYTVHVKEAGLPDAAAANLDHVLKSHQIASDGNNNLTFHAKGLDSRMKYEFWVTASTAIGEGKSSEGVVLASSAQVPTKIVSLSRTVTMIYKENGTLACVAVGIPTPNIIWRKNYADIIYSERIQQQPDGSLFLQNVTRNDAGEYSCYVENHLDPDFITYQVDVNSPPRPPQIALIASAANSFTIKLRPDPDDTEPTKKYKILYRLEDQRPILYAWQRIQLENPVETYTVENLFCNKQYVIQVIAYNSIGIGDPSEELLAYTLGGLPEKASTEKFIEPFSDRAVLHFDTWSKGGCHWMDFNIEIKQQTRAEWVQVRNIVDSAKQFFVIHLESDSWYNLRLTARNSVGSKMAEYEFATLPSSTYDDYEDE